jgi:hypothetical protein
METTHFSAPESPNPLGGSKPDPNLLPISAKAWEAAKGIGSQDRFLIPVLFDAIKLLEAELAASRSE